MWGRGEGGGRDEEGRRMEKGMRRGLRVEGGRKWQEVRDYIHN